MRNKITENAKKLIAFYKGDAILIFVPVSRAARMRCQQNAEISYS